MRDKKLESQIAKLDAFIERWKLFHDLFKKARGKEEITEQDESYFFQLKTDIAKNYNIIMQSLEIDDSKSSKGLEIVAQVLNLQEAREMSDGTAHRIISIWNANYIEFEKILGEMEHNRDELAKINSFLLFIKKLLWNPLTIILYLIAFIFAVYLGLSRLS